MKTIIFILIYTIIFGLLNLYFYKSLTKLTKQKPLLIITAIFIFFVFYMPFLSVLIIEAGFQKTGAAISFMGYGWMGALYLFIVFHVVGSFVIYIFPGTKTKKKYKILMSAALIFSSAILFYGRYEASKIKINRFSIKSEKIQKNKKIVIAQLSDIHFSAMTGSKKALKINKILHEISPDIVVSTGDILDRGIIERDRLIEIMNRWASEAEKIAVTGNHEYIHDIEDAFDFTEKAGFEVLKNKNTITKKGIRIAGIDEKASESNENKTICSENGKNLYTVALKHQPLINKSLSYECFDIMLSGHTHGGQIFPFKIFTRIAYKYVEGLYNLSEDTLLYVHRGTGTWGPPFRFMTPPEIAVFEISSH